MTQKVQEMAPIIWEAINKSNNILLHFHPSPDPDTVGCSLAMMQALKSIGKSVTLIKGDSDLPVWATKMPNIDQVTLKNYFEINPSDFDLFIIMDSSTPDMVSSLGEMSFPNSMTTVVIDHHITNKEFGKINLIDENYIACAEIIYDLLKSWGIEISNDIAGPLLLGIFADSGGFKYPRTDDQTFLAASELSKIAPDFTNLIFELENNDSPQRLMFDGLALNNIKTYFDNRVAISAVSLADLEKSGIDEKFTHKSAVPNRLKSVVGWDLGICMVESEPGLSHVSFRTRDPINYDVSKLAETLGGGGHKGAAGASIRKPFEQALKYLLEELARAYPDLGKP